jgi:hypothetical protein
MKLFRNIIKKHDLFGHVIQLNFNQNGSSHKTIVGGCFSTIIYTFMIFYILVSFNKLVNNGDNKNST